MGPASTNVIATCWTSAGNVAPLWSSERSPIPVDERVRAVAETGWAGFGISQDDLLAVRETIGFAGLRELIQDCGLRYTGVEILNHWWLCGEGVFPVVDFVATMRAVGYDGPWGVEVISDEHRARPLREALAVARVTVVDVVRPHA